MHARDHEQSSNAAHRGARHQPQGNIDRFGLLALQRQVGNAAVAQLVAGWQTGVTDVLRTPGRPLDEGVRSDMETRLGADFSDVRVHTDAGADVSAKSVQAEAYTSGPHVVFQHGRYNPSSTAGQHVLAHELTHVLQQRNGRVAGTETADGLSVSHPDDPFERAAEATATAAMSGPVQRTAEPAAGTGPTVIQRRVGFEFEDAEWHPWRRLRPNRGSVGSTLRPARDILPGYDSDTVVPAERKAVLEVDGNFQLEADDTPGPTLSNIEFVTEPFEETDEGVAALEATMARIKVILDRIDRFAGRPGPAGQGPPFPLSGQDRKNRFVRHREHGLDGSPRFDRQDVLLSGGRPGGALKMQATSGSRLEDLPAMMERLGRDVPGETGPQTQARRPERETIQDLAEPNEPLSIQGQAPSLARQVVGRLQQDATIGTAFTSGTEKLTGFLAAVMLSMKLLRRPNKGPVKYRLTLLPRNSFAQMFGLLPQEQMTALRDHPAILAAALIDVSNAHPLIQLGSDRGLTAGSPLIGPVPGPITGVANGQPTRAPISDVDAALATVTIQDWITGITTGHDYLTPTEMRQWLTGQNQVSDDARGQAADALESFGSQGALDTRAGGQQLALFELRAVAPLGAGANLTLDQATEYAVRILRFFKAVREGN